MCIVQLVDYIALALETTGERIITAEAQNSSGIDMHQNTDALFLGDLRGTTRLRKPYVAHGLTSRPRMPTAISGGKGISCLVGRHRCRQYGWLLTHFDRGGCSCMTASSSSQNNRLMKSISSQFGQRFLSETETCSHSMPTSASPGLARTIKSRPQGPGIWKAPKSSPGLLPYSP